ncbi:MAG: hypothetical protein ACMXX6_02070 [Candidatus Woesearchaeota archaeon]
MGLNFNQKIELIEGFKDRVVSKKDILSRLKPFCGDDSDNVFNSLRRLNKISFLFNGYYYIFSEDERSKGIRKYSVFELIAVVLNKLNVKWYFGLETADEFNKVKRQASNVIYVVNNKFCKSFNLDGQKVVFKKAEFISEFESYMSVNRIKLNVSSVSRTLRDYKFFKQGGFV